MAKFMCVFRGGAFVEKGLSPAEVGAHLQKWNVWVSGLAKAGHIEPGGSPLQGGGKVIRGRNKLVTDGPYAEAKDLVTGNLILIAASLDEATDIAHGCPIYEFDGSLELRPVFEREG
jgi:hypothetical protein